MSRKFKISTKYYGDRKIYKKATVEINPGITVLVGCNGSGKTTFLHQLKTTLEKGNIPVIYYDNLYEGGSRAKESAMFYGDIQLCGNLMLSSEGEQITLNLGTAARKIGSLLREDSDEYWILLDAIDSGLSVDQVQDVKRDLLHMVMEYEKGKIIYFVVSCNEYEMCVDEPCFNVTEGKYVSINSYDDYKAEILKTREYKNKSCQ